MATEASAQLSPFGKRKVFSTLFEPGSAFLPAPAFSSFWHFVSVFSSLGSQSDLFNPSELSHSVLASVRQLRTARRRSKFVSPPGTRPPIPRDFARPGQVHLPANVGRPSECTSVRNPAYEQDKF